MSETDQKPPSRFPRGVVVRVGVALSAVALVVVLINGSHKTQTVSEVIDEIHAIALAEPHGGVIGRWWVSAAGVDSGNGRLQSFKVECGPVHIAARSARVIVNPLDDTFKFEMWDVVMVRLDKDEESIPVDMDRYVLGPLPYNVDIVADKKTATVRSLTGVEDTQP